MSLTDFMELPLYQLNFFKNTVSLCLVYGHKHGKFTIIYGKTKDAEVIDSDEITLCTGDILCINGKPVFDIRIDYDNKLVYFHSKCKCFRSCILSDGRIYYYNTKSMVVFKRNSVDNKKIMGL